MAIVKLIMHIPINLLMVVNLNQFDLSIIQAIFAYYNS